MSKQEEMLNEIERLRETLKFYADPKTYERQYEGFQPGFGDLFTPAAIDTDLRGSKARAALSTTATQEHGAFLNDGTKIPLRVGLHPFYEQPEENDAALTPAERGDA